MAQTFTLDLVTPERTLASQEVEMVEVPGTDGDFGVLAGHAPLISTIRPGVIKLHEKGKVTERVLVTEGFAEVTGERCTILATEAFFFSDTSREGLEKRLEKAKQIRDKAKEEEDKVLAEKEVHLAQSIVDVFITELDKHS